MARRPWNGFVAVVDDEESVRRAFARLIRSRGLDAETYPSGEAFLSSLPTRRPGCVVLDLHMPSVGGLEVQARMADAGVRIPVIVVTGHDTPEAEARALRAGAVAYLRKPVDEGALMEAIRAAVEGGPGSHGTGSP